MLWTVHARERLKERFGLEPHEGEALYAVSRLAGKAVRKKIRRYCSKAAKQWMDGFNGRYYTITPDRTVFVVGAPDTIITVFSLGEYDYAEKNKAQEFPAA